MRTGRPSCTASCRPLLLFLFLRLALVARIDESGLLLVLGAAAEAPAGRRDVAPSSSSRAGRAEGRRQQRTRHLLVRAGCDRWHGCREARGLLLLWVLLVLAPLVRGRQERREAGSSRRAPAAASRAKHRRRRVLQRRAAALREQRRGRASSTEGRVGSSGCSSSCGCIKRLRGGSSCNQEGGGSSSDHGRCGGARDGGTAATLLVFRRCAEVYAGGVFLLPVTKVQVCSAATPPSLVLCVRTLLLLLLVLFLLAVSEAQSVGGWRADPRGAFSAPIVVLLPAASVPSCHAPIVEAVAGVLCLTASPELLLRGLEGAAAIVDRGSRRSGSSSRGHRCTASAHARNGGK